MIESITIPKELPQDSALSYDFLRAEGIKHIQQLAGHIWTDHNTHDPGITILEQLCYAITDLGYRVDNDIQDLLGSNTSSSYRDLYGPASILTVNPVAVGSCMNCCAPRRSVLRAARRTGVRIGRWDCPMVR